MQSQSRHVSAILSQMPLRHPCLSVASLRRVLCSLEAELEWRTCLGDRGRSHVLAFLRWQGSSA